jgi:O-antigen/teichoic acid export membrane protein
VRLPSFGGSGGDRALIARSRASPSPSDKREGAEARTEIDMAWGMRMAFLDNVLRLVEPLLVLACASLYAGGSWGSFKLAESTAYLLFRVSLLGLDRGIVWWYGQTDDPRYSRDLIASLMAVLAASLLGSVIMMGLSTFAFGSIRGLSLPWHEALLVAAAIPLLAVSEVLYQANLNQKNMIARILGKNIVLPLTTFGGALVGHVLHGPGLPTWFFLGCASNAAVALTSFLSLHHRFSWSELCPRMPDRSLLSFSLPLTGTDLLTGLTGRIDLMLLGELADIRAVEIYNVVTMIGRSLQAIRESFDSMLLSAFSGEGARRMTSSLRERLNHATWAVGNLMGVALMVVVFWGRDLLSYLNPQYGDSYLALIVMTAFTYLNVFGDMSGLMLQGLGRTRSWGLARVIGFASNLVCNLWWIPLWGALGGVLALKVSELVQGILSQVLLRRESGKRIWIRTYMGNYAIFASALLILCGISLMEMPLQLRIPLFTLAATAWLASYRNYSIQFVRRIG